MYDILLAGVAPAVNAATHLVGTKDLAFRSNSHLSSFLERSEVDVSDA